MILLDQTFWEIKKSGSFGNGLFAKKDIPAGTLVGDYIGKVVPEKEVDNYDKEGHFYLMYYHDTASIYPDLSRPGIHVLNHSCTPNAWMYTYKGHTLFFTIRHIFAGEEITISYLLAPQDEACNPCTHLCYCGTMICSQTMHLSDERFNKWIEVMEEEEKLTKRQRIRFNQTIPLLDEYPGNFADKAFYTLFGSEKMQPIVRNDKKLPTITDMRNVIRQTGKMLVFPYLNLQIFGIQEDIIFSKPLATTLHPTS